MPWLPIACSSLLIYFWAVKTVMFPVDVDFSQLFHPIMHLHNRFLCCLVNCCIPFHDYCAIIFTDPRSSLNTQDVFFRLNKLSTRDQQTFNRSLLSMAAHLFWLSCFCLVLCFCTCVICVLILSNPRMCFSVTCNHGHCNTFVTCSTSN